MKAGYRIYDTKEKCYNEELRINQEGEVYINEYGDEIGFFILL